MKILTVKELKKLCDEQVKLGNEDRTIMISDDDEGNGFHYLIYSFTYSIEELKELEKLGTLNIDENISKLEDTIILG